MTHIDPKKIGNSSGSDEKGKLLEKITIGKLILVEIRDKFKQRDTDYLDENPNFFIINEENFIPAAKQLELLYGNLGKQMDMFIEIEKKYSLSKNPKIKAKLITLNEKQHELGKELYKMIPEVYAEKRCYTLLLLEKLKHLINAYTELIKIVET